MHTGSQLLARLAPSENVSIMQVRNPRCPQRQRIAKVWVLSAKSGHPVRPPATASPPAARDAHPRNADEVLTEIQRAHGIDPEQARREGSR